MKNLHIRHKAYSTITFLLAILLLIANSSLSQEPQINWTPGPSVVDLGGDVAQITLSEGYLFADAEDTKKLMESMGNPSAGDEVGLIVSADQNTDYYILFCYNPVGYVKDDEKENIDSDAILQDIRRGTEQANKERKNMGFAPINVVGWYEEPHYDTRSHNLVWAILGESEGAQMVNYDVRLLGRHGYMSATLVTDPTTLAADKHEIDHTISNFSFKKGKSYAEFVQGDRIAKYGLTALIAGGATAVAVKTGLFKALAKAWKLVLVGIAAFFGAIWKGIKYILGRGGEETKMPIPK